MEKPEAIPIIMCTVFYETEIKEALKIMEFYFYLTQTSLF